MPARSGSPTAARDLGIDLGLKFLAAFSDPALPTAEARHATRDFAPRLANAQRARKPVRERAIHVRGADRTGEFLHKLSTRLHQCETVVVGNVSAAVLVRTRHAKLVLAAGWSVLRTMLWYTCADAGA